MKIGLVLAGGGARGSYQVGAIRALRELSIDKYIKVVSGTSIGALNAMLFMNGNLEESVDIWNKINSEQVLPMGEKNLNIKSMLLGVGVKNIEFIKKYVPRIILGGNISRCGLVDIMDKIDFSFVKSSEIICYAACTEITNLKTKYFRVNDYEEVDIKKILLATSAIPMIYESEEIEKVKYLDGGIVDNVPITPVYKEGCDIIIIIHLAKISEIDRRLFPNTHIIEIVPTIIEDESFKDMLEFNEEMSKKRMKIGYEDTIEIIKPIMELTKFIENEGKEDARSNLSFKERLKRSIKAF